MTFKEILKNQKEALTGISTKDGTKIVTYKEKTEYNHCGRPTCDADTCTCVPKSSFNNEGLKPINEIGLDAWIKVMEEEDQPTCNIEDPEDCENCGS